MFRKTYPATHPDMMAGASNDQLRERYLIDGLFAPGQVVLNYSHNERFVIGGAAPTTASVSLPQQTEPASAAAQPHLSQLEEHARMIPPAVAQDACRGQLSVAAGRVRLEQSG